MISNCVCGHTSDEHEPSRTGYAACDVEGCDCFLYEWDGDEFDRDDGGRVTDDHD
jgi:hypothetical protein